MRMSKQLIKDVVQEVAGDEGIKAAQYLSLSEGIAEEDLAKKMKQELKITRNILYQLQKHNLVEFKRKRNDSNGWYTYFWSFNQTRIKDLAKKIAMAKLERYNYQLSVEENTQFFTCGKNCVRVDYESVLSFNYTCPECGCDFAREDNRKRIKDIKTKIKDINTHIKA
jgi:transcription factor E